jgi:hypothetical protein
MLYLVARLRRFVCLSLFKKIKYEKHPNRSPWCSSITARSYHTARTNLASFQLLDKRSLIVAGQVPTHTYCRALGSRVDVKLLCQLIVEV